MELNRNETTVLSFRFISLLQLVNCYLNSKLQLLFTRDESTRRKQTTGSELLVEQNLRPWICTRWPFSYRLYKKLHQHYASYETVKSEIIFTPLFFLFSKSISLLSLSFASIVVRLNQFIFASVCTETLFCLFVSSLCYEVNKEIRKSYPTRLVRFFNTVCLRLCIYSSHNATLISLCILPDNEISRYVVWYKRYARFLKREPRFVAISRYKEVPTPLSTFIYQLTFSYGVSEHLSHFFIGSFSFLFYFHRT